MISAYGMTEMNSFSVLCDHDHYHVLPWVTVFQLDLETGQPLPRKGVQTGRAAFFDMTQDSTWGGLITGDLVTIDWDNQCKCGRTSVSLQKRLTASAKSKAATTRSAAPPRRRPRPKRWTS